MILTWKRLFGVMALLAVGLLVLAGCGQDSSQSGGSASGGGSTPEETTAGGGSASGGGGSASGGGSVSGGEAFAPSEGSLVVYSGRNEELVGPIIERFEEESGAEVEVRYGDTAELAATIMEEGENGPADVYFAQDPGALGAVADRGRFAELPQEILELVPEEFSSPDGEWVGISGRARTVAYNTEALSEEDLPPSILDFTDPQWQGRIGWAPTNGSFQAFVTALRAIEGEETARQWLEGIQANDPFVYENNTAIVEGVAAGEVDVGFVNHYYVARAMEERGEDFGARNYYLEGGDPGSLVIVAGAGILNTADNPEAAESFIEYMLSEEAQQYFTDETQEYPLVEGVQPPEGLVPLSEIETPEIDLGDLDDLEGTLDLLRETGVL
ncbi:iron ABC transporter substrate-binding protein [soil metagenome]